MDGLPPRHALATFIDLYVSPSHRDDRADGCPMTALNSDMPTPAAGRARGFRYGGVKTMVASMKNRLSSAGVDNADGLAPAVLAAMVGAVSLSRAVSDKIFSDELLVAARSGIKARLGLNDNALSEFA